MEVRWFWPGGPQPLPLEEAATRLRIEMHVGDRARLRLRGTRRISTG
jgi:hypothetical protein